MMRKKVIKNGTVRAQPGPITLDLLVEKEVRSNLLQHYAQTVQNPANYVDMLLDASMYVDRFQYLHEVIGPNLFTESALLLCSGFSIGTEMIMARQFGFGLIHGVEVDPFLVEETQRRLSYLADMHPIYYDGDILPYTDDQFDVITSGHVIEHTRRPELYVSEMMRVLRKGGYISLEFPDRFHIIELHTRLFSFEWLPHRARNGMIHILASRFSPLPSSVKSRYHSIVSTNLQQISIGNVKKMLEGSRCPFVIVDLAKPAPGIIRCVIQKL
jgi:ubiquinone/menaquinone biosynthesis C-methylase UbiE